MKIDQIILIIDEVGYPVLMAIGMGYFIWYVWKYVTKELKPKISASHKTLIKLFTEKVVGCHFVMIGASIMLLSLLTNNFYIILGVLCIYGFAIANLVPIVIRQAVKQSNESIPMTVTNLITIGLSSTMIMPAAIGFLAETFSLTLNMYLLSIIVFTSGFVFLLKFK